LARDVVRLDAESKTLDQKLQRAEKRRDVAQNIEKWAAGDIVWLDALYTLNEKFPPTPTPCFHILP